MKSALLLLIKSYRLFISPLTPPVCRLEPTCSCYALEAIERFGPLKGSGLAIRRVTRCHPFHPGGYDPVPPTNPHSPISKKHL
ncbi:MAG: membrane protein insertion efficiency factor YidD [Phormidesmis sp.]